MSPCTWSRTLQSPLPLGWCGGASFPASLVQLGLKAVPSPPKHKHARGHVLGSCWPGPGPASPQACAPASWPLRIADLGPGKCTFPNKLFLRVARLSGSAGHVCARVSQAGCGTSRSVCRSAPPAPPARPARPWPWPRPSLRAPCIPQLPAAAPGKGDGPD